MTNEAVCIVKPTLIVTRNCYDGQSIAKGTLCKLSGTNYAAPTDATMSAAAFAGITVEEKTASDGVTTIACAMDGVWDIYNGKGITPDSGSMVMVSGANTYTTGTAGALLSGAIIGQLEEKGTSGGADRVRLGIF